MTLVRFIAWLACGALLVGCRGPRPAEFPGPTQVLQRESPPSQLQPLPRDRTLQLTSHTQSTPPNTATREAVATVPLPSVAELEPLSLAELEELALSGNPAIAEAAALVEAAHGVYVQAGLPPNTVIGYSGQQLSSHGQAEQQGVFVGQQWIRGGKLALDQAIACHDVEKAQQQLAAQRQRVLTDVRLAFSAALIAQRRVELARQGIEFVNKALSTVETLRAAMEVGEAEVARARIERQETQLVLANALSTERATWRQLATVVGVGHLEPRPLAGSVAFDAIRTDQVTGERLLAELPLDEFDVDASLARILGGSPEIAAAITEIQKGYAKIDRAHAEPTPDVDIQTVFQSDNGTGSSNFNLQISAPIPWRDRNQGGIQQAHAELVAAEHAAARLELRLQQQLLDVYQQYAYARNQVEQYASPSGILATWQETVELMRGAYEAGEVGYLDVITAQQERAEAELVYLDAVGEMQAAAIEIEGLLLKNSLGSE